MTATPFTLYIQSNSPGELCRWVAPVCTEIQALRPEAEIHIYLTPCQYATGEEKRIAAELPQVKSVKTPKETIKWLRQPRMPKPAAGAILFLGGDPVYARFLAFRTGLPAYAYTEKQSEQRPQWRGFTHVFTRALDGDLMASHIQNHLTDRAALLKRYKLPDTPRCLFLCGSRPQHFIPLLPIMLAAIRCIQESEPDFPALLMVSPFISDAVWKTASNGLDLTGIRVIQPTHPGEFMQLSRMIVTIPGSNTAEAMYRLTPMLMILPTNKPEALILDGLPGLIGKLPGIKKYFMKSMVTLLLKRTAHYALPNIILGQSIVPELIGHLSPEIIAATVLRYFHRDDLLERQISAFQSLPDWSGTAARMVRHILQA